MTPIFKCLICRKDIERSTKTFWSKKGHLLCSTCLDNIDKKKFWIIKFKKILFDVSTLIEFITVQSNKPKFFTEISVLWKIPVSSKYYKQVNFGRVIKS